MKILELFGGIGACTQALKRLGIDFEIADYVEIDKYAVKSYNAINGTNFEPQDITQWDKNIEVDLVMHGSPCQDFSLSGKQAGGDEGSGTRSSLMYETIRIVEKLKPKYVVWENVKNLLSKKHRHNFDNYLEKLEELGYNNYYQVLNAKDYGIPQNRERVYTISIRKDIDNGTFTFPEKEELKLRLKDILEDEVDEKYYLNDNQIVNITNWKSFRNPIKEAQTENDICNCVTAKGNTSLNASMLLIKNANKFVEENNRNAKHQQDLLQTAEGVCRTIPAGTHASTPHLLKTVITNNRTICLNSKAGRNGIEGLQPSRKDRIYDSNGIATTIATSDFYNPNYTENLRIRKLTPKECWRLMGFSDECFEKAEKVNSNTQLYKQAGNSIVVDVLYKIFKNLFNIG